MRPAVRVQCTHARVTAGRGGQAVAVPSCGHDDACAAMGPGFTRMRERLGRCARVARGGADGHALHAQGWKHEDEDEVPSDEQDSDGSGVDPARLRSAPAARLTKGPRMRC